MAYEIVVNTQTKITGVAGADLTGSQYLLVKQNTAGLIVPVTAATDIPLGVLQNAPRISQECEVVVGGGSKVVASAGSFPTAVAPLISTDATGKTRPIVAGTDTTAYQVGRALTFPATAGEIFTALVELSSPGRAA